MKRILLLLGLSVFCQALYAQNIVVKGVVKSEQGEPLPGASVQEKGTKNGKVTDNNGNYQITVSPSATLVFSFIGTKAKEELVNGRKTINATLADLKNNLNEVVVVGYGTVKRKDVTGAISSIKGEDLAKMPVQDVASALEGRLAGVSVSAGDGTPGSQPSITIRGGGSITQSNEPLYVVDGIPQTDGLSFLDPTDIESIDVLKDASATSIYGARGANGVILVTTKKSATGKVTVGYDMYYGIKKVTKTLPMLNPYQYVLLEYERSLGDATKSANFLSSYGTFDQIQSLYGNQPGVNWQNELFGGTTHNQYHKFSISGGSKETNFTMFYSRNIDQGIMINSGSNKDVAKLQVSHSKDKLKATGIVNFSNQTIYGSGTQEGNTKFNQLQNILQYRPTLGLKGSDQSFINMDQDPNAPDGSIYLNPITTANSQYRNTNIKVLNLNGSLDYELLKNLTYRGLVGYRYIINEADLFNDSRSISALRSGGPNGSINQSQENGWNYSNTLTYSNNFNKDHHFDMLIGQEQVYTKVKTLGISSNMFPNVNLGLNDLSEGTLPGTPSSSLQDERLLSFFTRANYSYKDTYILSGSLRADGSSKFGANNKFGYFPSAAFAWRIINESFMKEQKAFSDLKLRLSYGSSGNNRINNFLSLSLLQAGNYPLNNNNVITASASTLANPDLKWETTTSKDIGLDLGLFNQRVQFTFDVYDNRTTNLLLNAAIPASSGFNTELINVGSTSNRGLEFAVNTVNIRSHGFQWNTAFNIAFNRNKVLALTNGESTRYVYSWSSGVAGGINSLGETDYLVQVGAPVGQMYGYRFNGLYRVSDFDYNAATQAYTLKAGIPYDPNNVPKPGYIRYADLNNDGKITAADRTVIGNAQPKFTGGLNNTFSYKGIDLSIFINWSVGGKVYDANRLYGTMTQNVYPNTFAYVADRWMTIDASGNRVTDPVQLAAMNQGKNYPAYNGAGTVLRLDDRFIEDGSFLRISNVSLGYTLPKAWINKLKLSRVRVYVTGNNLKVFSHYFGYDPEVSVYNSSRLTPGVDFGGYPRVRSFLAGLNVAF
ncbi:TonB-linked SusC/RagA family outer membrane protein [Mucilaginibacter yixingensis]|uniref:TonB-linked SusC/RagA family outer membrane protein n=1 Tax=Mucilaginibacter yixingensis TaxID=1295612 RepID=A0A2T5J6B6_9SPHI|nr:TonB-dependent receptor [Mucilaginibacter yixingensis]PTQ93986.1 TonB-linked SusC/RagA family outer membrane protein [Mucilaginibacter yixingensis]